MLVWGGVDLDCSCWGFRFNNGLEMSLYMGRNCSESRAIPSERERERARVEDVQQPGCTISAEFLVQGRSIVNVIDLVRT